MRDLETDLKKALKDVVIFAAAVSGLRLRKYQKEVARAIVESVRTGAGRSIVVIFPRQSGKNELQAQIECYLLTIFHLMDAEMVKASPTWKPQSLNAMRRLERVLSKCMVTAGNWTKESGYIYKLGSARIYFLSGSDSANVVGATANRLLECDEAQDISCSKWDKDFAPMAASTNATRVFWGTAWTSKTLLARERIAAEEAQAEDGIRRVWVLSADDVAAEVPPYGEFDLSTLPVDKLGAPTYRVVARYTWIGTKHTKIYNQLKELANKWRAEYIIIDSTGVGAGLSSFMEKAYPGRVIPFLFTSKSKSDLGWQFLAVIETGRYKEPVGERSEFWQQVSHCMNEVRIGPGRLMRWGVPDGTRDSLTGDLIHDDQLISSSLCAILDEQEWSISGAPVIIARVDPLAEMDSEGF